MASTSSDPATGDGRYKAINGQVECSGAAESRQACNALTRAAGLASAAVRLAATVSEGAAEGLFNAAEHLYEALRLPAVVRRTLSYDGGQEPYPAALTGQVAIVTGGNAGIGFATAQQLARRGAHVVLACRDRRRAEAAAQAIARTPPLPGCCGGSGSSTQPTTFANSNSSALAGTAAAAASSSSVSSPHPSPAPSPPAPSPSQPPAPVPKPLRPLSVEVMELDLGRLSSVRAFAETWRARGLPLNLLVCNAGVMAPLQRTTTADGLEVQFQVNFLSHWLLAHLLLDHERERRRRARAESPAKERKAQRQEPRQESHAAAVAAAAAAASSRSGLRDDDASNNSGSSSDSTRVVVVSSVVHRAGLLQWDDLLSERSYEPYITYGASKLATVIFAKELQRRLDRHPEYGMHDSAVAIHPGIVRTHLANGFFRSYGLSWAVGTPLEPLHRLWQRIWDATGHALLATPDTAARRMLAACLGPSEQLAGRYMALGRVYRADKASDDPVLAEQLWTTAVRLTGTSPPPSLS